MSKKRKLVDELMQGVNEMREHRHAKITLRKYKIDALPVLKVDAVTIQKIREKMNLSQPLFARSLRVSVDTLKNWEQGRSKPNAQAAALILMVDKYPDTIEKLQSLDNNDAAA